MKKARSTFIFTKSKVANPKSQTPQTQNYAQILESDESKESRPHNDRSASKSGLGSDGLSFKVFNRFYCIRIISSSSSNRVKTRKKGKVLNKKLFPFFFYFISKNPKENFLFGCHTSGTSGDDASKRPGQTSAETNKKFIQVTPECLGSKNCLLSGFRLAVQSGINIDPMIA